MDNITVYRIVKNPKIAAAIYVVVASAILSLLVCNLLGICKIAYLSERFLIPFIVVVCLNTVYPFFQFYVKYIVNETDLTFRAKGTGSKRIIPIHDIYKIEIYRTKKGKIKYFLLRTPPFAYMNVNPWDKQPFLDHLLRLNPKIEIDEKSASLF